MHAIHNDASAKWIPMSRYGDSCPVGIELNTFDLESYLDMLCAEHDEQ